MPIRVLDAATVGRIAAGEVVERPGSVVKELIENSLDAGATSVTVEIRGGGIEYLRVTDNGCGIEPGQVRLAFENHATSKLQSAQQLDDIRTLGFRGEALPSIAAVSRVEMTTRAKNQDCGMKYTCEGGKNASTTEAGCPQGTTIIMRDLFFNVPVRREFLKKPSYEGGLVSDTVTRMLLGNPGVSMRFISGGNTLYHSFGDGKLRHAVFSVYGRETAEQMIELDASEGGVRIFGLIGVGELAKATRAHQMFYINGRSVRCPLIARALEQVCRSRVTIGMYPMCVLNLVLPSTAVDVNVHPNKLEVRFRDEEMMRESCERLLARAFADERVLDIDKLTAPKPVMEKNAQVREIPLARPLPATEEKEKAAPVREELPKVEPAKPAPLPKSEPLPKPEQTRMRLTYSLPQADVLREDRANPAQGSIKTVDLSVLTAPKGQTEPPRKEASAPEQKEIAPEADIPVRIIGVAFKTYIIAEANDTLLLIDQHAAHERLQYERYMARCEAGAASQQLLTPLLFHVTRREMAIIEDNLDLLTEAGYSVEPFGESDIQVRAVPFVLGKAEIRPLFLEMLQSLGGLRAATVDARRAEIMQMACKSAVKAGDELADSEIRALIRAMLATDAPPTCPHGRPVVKALTRRDLEKMFKRIQ